MTVCPTSPLSAAPVYRDGFGRFGSYQLQHRVYGRGGKLCLRCGARIRVLVIVGRSSFYCPSCQR
jgi:formamidopyrimidine-DNA glycosylase